MAMSIRDDQSRARFWGPRVEGPQVTEIDGAVALEDAFKYPGHGMPYRPGDDKPALQAWARLIRGQPIGKKEILSYNAGTAETQDSMTTILTAGGQDGSDLDACQMTVTLSQPRVIKAAFANGGVVAQNQQNTTGSYDNAGVGTANFPGTAAPLTWVPIIGIIEWGLGGTRQTAYVDFSQGTVINLSASWVRVHAAVALDAVDNAAGNSALYELAAFVGPGWTQRGAAQRTVFLGAIANNAESAVFAVPPFARRATVISMDPEAVGTASPVLTSAYLRFWQGPTGVTAGKNIGNYFQAGNAIPAFDVPNGAAYFSVQNQSGANLKHAVIFELAI
jgi:hypothetical protein